MPCDACSFLVALFAGFLSPLGALYHGQELGKPKALVLVVVQLSTSLLTGHSPSAAVALGLLLAVQSTCPTSSAFSKLQPPAQPGVPPGQVQSPSPRTQLQQGSGRVSERRVEWPPAGSPRWFTHRRGPSALDLELCWASKQGPLACQGNIFFSHAAPLNVRREMVWGTKDGSRRSASPELPVFKLGGRSQTAEKALRLDLGLSLCLILVRAAAVPVLLPFENAAAPAPL